jgi:hypothetical protein
MAVNMLTHRRLILILCLIIPLPAAWAQKAGLYLSNDSVEAYSLSDANDMLPRHSRQQYSLAVSSETYPRNILLRADAELVDNEFPFKLGGTMTPKVLLSAADFFDHRFIGIGGGAVLRNPPTEERHYELVTEVFIAPHLSDYNDSKSFPWHVDFAWTWGFKIQANYTLPDADNAEINLGFHRTQLDIRYHKPASFDTGIFFGLTSRF